MDERWIRVRGEPVMGTATLASGAAPACAQCGVVVGGSQVVVAGEEGYTIATVCQCGWYSQESGWFGEAEEAEAALAAGDYAPP